MEVDEEQNYEKMDDESESSSNSSIDSEFVQTLRTNAKQVRDRINLNPYDYGGHVELIKIYEDAKSEIQFDDELFNELREAREFMHKYYPLEPTLWLSWLNDEINNSQNNQEYLLELFEHATKDYTSVDIWKLYLKYIIGLGDSSVDVIKIFDRALISVGLHPINGQTIWDTYRDYQEILMDFKETDEEKAKQLYSIFELYKRQLSIPHDKMQNTFEKFQEWMSRNNDAIKIVETNFNRLKFDVEHVNRLYEKAKSELTNIMPFEERLIESNKSLEAYYEYLNYEKKTNRPERIQFLFERIITDYCLTLDVWIKYLDYLKENLNIYDVIKALLDRAVRNVIHVRFWKEYINLNEIFNRPIEETQNLFEKSLEQLYEESLGQIWLHYLQFKRRMTNFKDANQVEKLRKIFEQAVTHLNSIKNGDPEFKVSIFQAQFEAHYCDNIAESRKIWIEIMKFHKALDNQKKYWLLYADLERSYGDKTGDLKPYKLVMLEALKFCPESFTELSEKLMDDFNLKCNNKQEIDNVEKRIKHVFYQFVRPQLIRQQAETVEKDRKRKMQNDSKSDTFASKKGKFESQEKPPVNKPFKPNEINELETIMVSNLDFNAQEDEIRNLFAQFGTIKDLRLIRDHNKRSKGYCFIEFHSVESVRRAIQQDRKLELRGREVYINEYNKKKEFGYERSLEKNKLFVSNLPLNADYNDQLKEIFGKLKGFKDIRISKHRNGHPKGNAYVDFSSDEDALNALQQTNGLEIGKKKIRVQISDPPKRRDSGQAVPFVKYVESLGSTSTFKKPTGRAKRLQLT